MERMRFVAIDCKASFGRSCRLSRRGFSAPGAFAWVAVMVVGATTLSTLTTLDGADDPGKDPGNPNAPGQPAGALKVKKVTRLTPPQVAGNVTDRFYCVHSAFNSDSTRVAFFENPSRCTRTTQNRWPVGARMTTHRSMRLSTVAPSFSSRATSATISSVSMSM